MPLKKRFLIITLVVFCFVISCKSSKSLSSEDANMRLSAKELIKQNAQQEASFKTLTARVKLEIFHGKKTEKYTVNMRMEKNEKILLMSTPISVIKALITPENVSFYNKLDNTYFEGDFKYLSDLLGTEIDFRKLQNLLLGEALFDLKKEPVMVSTNNRAYVVQPKKQNPLFELFYLISPSHFKITSQQLSQPQELRHLQIDYQSFQVVDKQILPETIKIIAIEGAEEFILEMEFKGVSLNEGLRFPYKIPSGFKEIKL